MQTKKEPYNDKIIVGSISRAIDKDVETYYVVDLDSLYKLYYSRKKKASRRKEPKTDVNQYIEEQLRTGASEETVKHRVNSFLRTLNQDRKEIRNEEEREIFDRLQNRLDLEERAIELETMATFLRSIPGAMPYGVSPEICQNASEAYAQAIIKADPKEREKFLSKLDSVLLYRAKTIGLTILFRKCLDIEISRMIDKREGRDAIESTIKKRIEEFKANRVLPYSPETIAKAKVLAKIDDLESGLLTYVDEEEYVPVKERLKMIRETVKENHRARRLAVLNGNKK